MTNHIYCFYANLDYVPYATSKQHLDKHEKISAMFMKKEEVIELMENDEDTSAMMLNALKLAIEEGNEVSK